MTLSGQGRGNSFRGRFPESFHSGPYLKINIALSVVVLLVLAYSLVFSPDRNNYPVVCIHEKLTGMKCFSCGLSHSFSLIVRGRVEEAYKWNVYGMQVFLFFFLQLVMRICFSVIYTVRQDTRRQLILMDIAGSVLIFVIAFLPFFREIFLELFYIIR